MTTDTLAHDARALAERIALALDDGHGPHEPSWPSLLTDAVVLLRGLAVVVEGVAFYSHTPDGFEVHCSAGDAAATAAGWLEPDGEWPEDIESVEWGVVRPIERAKQRDRVETPGGEFDYTSAQKRRGSYGPAFAPVPGSAPAACSGARGRGAGLRAGGRRAHDTGHREGLADEVPARPRLGRRWRRVSQIGHRCPASPNGRARGDRNMSDSKKMKRYMRPPPQYAHD